MPKTCADLITECEAQLHGWGSTQDRVTPLSTNIGATDLTFKVDYAFGQAVGISPGIVQIDSELIYVVSVDATTNIATVANGFGRGYRGTTAASHVAGTPIITRPKFPRVDLFNELNLIIGAVFPDLFAVETYTTTVTYPSNTYTLPGAQGVPMSVLDAQWQDPIGNWIKCPGYTIDPYDGTFRLGSGPMIGRPLRILYAVQPRLFTSESDQFAAVTGLPESASDVLTLGVVAKLVPGLDISRAQLSSVEQSDRSRVVPPNAGVNVGKYLMALYQDRLSNEATSLRRQYRPRITRVF